MSRTQTLTSPPREGEPAGTSPANRMLTTVEQKNICKMSGLTSTDLSVLKHWRREWGFFMMVFVFSFQLKPLSKTTPKYLYVPTLSTSTSSMTTVLGCVLFFFLFFPWTFLLNENSRECHVMELFMKDDLVRDHHWPRTISRFWGYRHIYSPVTYRYALEFVLVTFQSFRTNSTQQLRV